MKNGYRFILSKISELWFWLYGYRNKDDRFISESIKNLEVLIDKYPKKYKTTANIIYLKRLRNERIKRTRL